MAQGHPDCQTVSKDKSKFNHHLMAQGHPDCQTVSNDKSILTIIPWHKDILTVKL